MLICIRKEGWCLAEPDSSMVVTLLIKLRRTLKTINSVKKYFI